MVAAAKNGDARARADLIADCLPMVYNIVGRALHGQAEADDVVQEILLRVVRDLRSLRDPHSFRSWMMVIVVRQIRAHRGRQRAAAERFAVFEERFAALPGIEDAAVLRAHEWAQRRQIAQASHWLDADYRVLFSLWWRENAGQLTRAELAESVGLTVAHVGVRLQRMREQLEVSRTIVSALAAQPRCSALDVTTGGWKGQHTSLWRKRIARHVRDCPQCTGLAGERVPLERLLLSIAPLAVPAGLATALAAKGLLSWSPVIMPGLATASAATTSSATQISWFAKMAHAIAAQPVAIAATGAVLILAPAITYLPWPERSQQAAPVIATSRSAAPPAAPPGNTPAPVLSTPTPRPTPPPSPTLSPGVVAVPLGNWSVESVILPGQYLTGSGIYAALGQITGASSQQAREQATFTVVPGLADPECVTFRAADGRYLRHYELRMRLSPEDSTELFRKDATFCPVPGSVPSSVALRAFNYPALRIRFRGGALHVDPGDGSAGYLSDSSFVIRDPWAR
jgi:RNA polymerase sigma factor (sigma-70 family)